MADIIVADNTPRDIDPNEVLREYGLEDVAQTSTVVQQANGTTVTIPEGGTLTPPPIDGPTTPNIDNELDALANEMLNTTSASSDALSQDSGEPPVDLDEEEDEDQGRLEGEWIITEVAASNVEETVVAETPPPDEYLLDTQEPIDEGGSIVNEQTCKPLTAEDAINLLPANSMSYANDDTMSRFSGAMWFNAIQLSTVVLAGLGGIGRIW